MHKMKSLTLFENTEFQSSIMKMEAIELKDAEKILCPYYVQRKYNGCNTILIIDDYGNVQAYNKNFAIVPNLESAKQEAKKMLSGSRVYFCEAIVLRDGKEDFEEASRSFNPNNTVVPNGKVELAIFDSVTLDEYILGKSELNFSERWEELEEIENNYPVEDWDNIRFAHTIIIDPKVPNRFSDEKYITYYFNWGLTMGWEGDIIRFTDSKWNRRRIAEGAFKLIPIPTVELEIVGYNLGKGKHTGVAGTVIYKFRQWLKPNSPLIHLAIDGSLTYEQRKDIVDNFEKYNGKISKVSYKGFTRYGKLRQPKILEVSRHDKFESDIK